MDRIVRFKIQICGEAHAWCRICKPEIVLKLRKPKPPRKTDLRACRNCGRCDACLGLTAPEGMKYCRKCQQVKPLSSFSRRNDTGGYRNICYQCSNPNKGLMQRAKCAACGKWFISYKGRFKECASCRTKISKVCPTCGSIFQSSFRQRTYCSQKCQTAGQRLLRRKLREIKRLEILQIYGGKQPKCVCCGETNMDFLTIDHMDGGGHKQRKDLGGGGFTDWLLKEHRPGIQVLCYNCNIGKEKNNGLCPHKG